MSDLSIRLQSVLDRTASACERAGRDPTEVTLVAVSKTRSPGEVIEVMQTGQFDLGENYVQELLEKRDAVEVSGFTAGRWHLIGHLQTNKVKYVAPFCHLIHSVDSLKLATEISLRAGQQGRRQAVLLQVNIAGEEAKSGAAEEGLAELARGTVALPNVDLQGLMIIPPLTEDAEGSRPYYRRLRELAQGLQAAGIPAGSLRHLSMGMTNDFEVAVEEGATLVRVGTAIFGPRGT